MDFLIAFPLVLIHDHLLAPDQAQIPAQTFNWFISAGDGAFDILLMSVLGLRDREFVKNHDFLVRFEIFEIIEFVADLVEEDVVGLICEGLFGGLGSGSG